MGSARHQCDSAACIYHYLSTKNDIPVKLLPDLAHGLYLAGKTELALSVCREVVRRVPECGSAWFAMACYMAKLSHPIERIAVVVGKAFELCPDRVLYRVDFALLLSRCDRWEEAYRLLAAVELDELLGVHCPPRLAGMLSVFRYMNDESRTRACEFRITQIAQRHGMGPA